MPLDPRLLEILCCPACHGALRTLEADAGVSCQDCRRVYPMVDGILNMLVEEAKVPAP